MGSSKGTTGFTDAPRECDRKARTFLLPPIQVIDSECTNYQSMVYKNIREESQKLKVAAEWFPKFDCTDIIKRIDFAVKIKRDAESFDFEDE